MDLCVAVFSFEFVISLVLPVMTLQPASPSLQKLPTLPGKGWDALRSKELRQVLDLTYELPKTTPDGQYLVADQITTGVVRESELQLLSEIFEHYTNYSSVTSRSFKLEAFGAFAVPIGGSFSTNYQRIKMLHAVDKCITTRVHLRNTVYSVFVDPKSCNVDPHLKARLDEAAESVEANKTEKARLLLEYIVRYYGTHYLTHIDSGAVLLEEASVRSSFLKNNWAQRSKIKAAATANFLEKFKFDAGFQQDKDKELALGFTNDLVSSVVKAVGGSLLYPNMSVHNWTKSIHANLATIDRTGDPIYYIITSEKFPNLSSSTIQRMHSLLESVVSEYYNVNIHRGCTDVDSSNYNFQANVDDNSCKHPINNYTFGGLYQTCAMEESHDGIDLCESLTQPNPLTGSFSCPIGYDSLPLHSGSKTQGYDSPVCSTKCRGWWIFKTCDTTCHTQHYHNEAWYQTFWCAANGTVSPNSGLMFGGLYTSKSQNPLTRAMACPMTYENIRIGTDLKVCVSNDYQLGYRYSVPFGGFFSCSQMNPFKETDEVHCPTGYRQHIAIIDSGCDINYCVDANIFRAPTQILLKRPPFNVHFRS